MNVINIRKNRIQKQVTKIKTNKTIKLLLIIILKTNGINDTQKTIKQSQLSHILMKYNIYIVSISQIICDIENN